jgi:NAD(P)-dependent dehydrogenase (short-subunit alcohol dehydrogenase family)
MGADIVVAELDSAAAERTAAEVKSCGRRASVVPTDVTSLPDLRAMAERTRAQFGRIDILINNAGIYRAASPLDITRRALGCAHERQRQSGVLCQSGGTASNDCAKARHDH